MTEPLTIENLAKSIHEDQQQATMAVHGCRHDADNPGWYSWERLSEDDKNIRREQARLMLQRWMR